VLQGCEPVEGDGLAVPAGSQSAVAASTEPEPEPAGAAAGGGGELAEGVPHEEAPPLPQASDGAYVIDRDAGSWRHVVNYLRARRPIFKNGVRVGSAADEVVLPESKAELRQLAVDARWYALEELESLARAQLAETQAREETLQKQAAQIARLAETQAREETLQKQAAQIAQLAKTQAREETLQKQAAQQIAQLAKTQAREETLQKQAAQIAKLEATVSKLELAAAAATAAAEAERERQPCLREERGIHVCSCGGGCNARCSYCRERLPIGGVRRCPRSAGLCCIRTD
jgi:hypothetical protein